MSKWPRSLALALSVYQGRLCIGTCPSHCGAESTSSASNQTSSVVAQRHRRSSSRRSGSGRGAAGLERRVNAMSAPARDTVALARRIYDRSHLNGEFTLGSGATSDEYFDKYLFESDPELLREIAQSAGSIAARASRRGRRA